MLKQARVLLVGVVLAVVVLPASSAGAVAGYGDVADDRWFTAPVQWSVDDGITGLDGACFAPDRLVSRGEMAVWLWNMEGQPSAPAHSFVDVADAGQQGPVSWLVEEEITTGTSDTEFSPDNGLKRGEFAAFLWRLAGKPQASAHSFVDVAASWQQQPVSWLVDREITTGTSPTMFSPDNGLTRGQLVTFLHRYKGEPAVTINPHSPPCTPTFKTVSAGGLHSCAVRADDTITCWGYNEDGQAETPSGTFRTVSLGTLHSCAVRADDTITCWGYNSYGQPVAPSGTFRTVSAGGLHSCAVRTDDTITCWGNNEDGQTDAPSGTFRTVSAGGGHSCAVRTDDTITCWGNNRYGQPVAPSGTFRTVSAGGGHSCAVRTDDTITCWGNNEDGQTDAPSGTFRTVSAGGGHSCAVRTDDTITCWGNNRGRADRCAVGHVPNRLRRQRAFVRGPHRRHHHLLGLQLLRADRCAVGHVPNRLRRRPVMRHRRPCSRLHRSTGAELLEPRLPPEHWSRAARRCGGQPGDRGLGRARHRRAGAELLGARSPRPRSSTPPEHWSRTAGGAEAEAVTGEVTGRRRLVALGEQRPIVVGHRGSPMTWPGL